MNTIEYFLLREYEHYTICNRNKHNCSFTFPKKSFIIAKKPGGSSMLDFSNTHIAFASKSNKDLRRARFLFTMVSKPWLVKLGKFATQFALFVRLPINPIIKATIFKQFCGGETIQECDSTINELYKYGIGTILDYSVEGNDSPLSHDLTANEIIRTINRAQNDPSIPFAVFKVTGIARFSFLEKLNEGEAQLTEEEWEEYSYVMRRVENICIAAHTAQIPIFVDAEDYCIQNAIDKIVWKMMQKYNTEKTIIYNTIQAYRVDRLDYLKRIHKEAVKTSVYYGVKLVRGAYMEKERLRAEKGGYPSPIHPNKQATDDCYNECLRYIMKNLDDFSLCAGTHNEESSFLLAELIEKYKLEKDDHRIYFSQLLGMSDHISYNLSDGEYNVAKYVPFGPVRKVMPYLIRRAEENTSVAGQTGRELNLINEEIDKRKAGADHMEEDNENEEEFHDVVEHDPESPFSGEIQEEQKKSLHDFISILFNLPFNL